MAVSIQPERVLKDLQQLWAQLAHDGADAGGVLKACTMTLLVAAEDAADAERVRQVVGELMHTHPSRAIILKDQNPGSLDARVFAECWKPFGKNQQICAEGIEITPGEAGLEEASRFLIPLRVPDLPLVLWCRGASALVPDQGPDDRFTPLYQLASKIIFDSQHAQDPEGALDYMRHVRRRGRIVADLHWGRITGWREVLAHLFDDQVMKPQQVLTARIGYGGAAIATCARYFARWMEVCLPQAKVELVTEGEQGGLRSVTLETRDKKLELRRAGTLLHVEGAGRSYNSALPPDTEEALMRQELSIQGLDPVWDRVLAA